MKNIECSRACTIGYGIRQAVLSCEIIAACPPGVDHSLFQRRSCVDFGAAEIQRVGTEAPHERDIRSQRVECRIGIENHQRELRGDVELATYLERTLRI